MSLKKTTISLFLLALLATASAQIQLSDQAEISMVTIGPYDPELWSSWGHSAIRVHDPLRRIDIAYDFGRFSFQQERFYLNYALGTTYYSIGRFNDYEALRNHYLGQQRWVQEQVIDFTPQEVQQVFELLEENNRPENREYLYNYVYDNCATRLVDVVDTVLRDRVIYGESFMTEGQTIRDLMDDGLVYQPWGDLLIDLLLGSQIDQEANFREYLMMPAHVRDAFAGASINRDSVQVPLVRRTIPYDVEEPELANGLMTPFNTFVIVFFVVGLITNRNFKTQKRSKWLDALLFSVVGFLGCICVFLWVGTEHLSKWNYNLIWAIPFHLPAIWLLLVEKYRPFLVRYFRFTGVLYACVLVFWVVFPQDLHQSLIPFILMLALRAFYISYDVSKSL
ncbi:MAG: DUF4105 domain-containing protein [Bacteroidota bacterium]